MTCVDAYFAKCAGTRFFLADASGFLIVAAGGGGSAASSLDNQETKKGHWEREFPSGLLAGLIFYCSAACKSTQMRPLLPLARSLPVVQFR
jgi:hypothetical protein